MIAALLTLALAQPASGPSSRPAELGGTFADVRGTLTQILELGDDQLIVREAWSLENGSGRSVAADQVVLSLPRGAKRVRFTEEARETFQARIDGSAVFATKPLAPGTTEVEFVYEVNTDDGAVTLDRTVPIGLGGTRLILESTPNVTVSSSIESSRRLSDLNGHNFLIHDFVPIAAGQGLSIQVRGLPSHSPWPVRIALALVGLVLAFGFLAYQRPPPPLARSYGVLSASARKERLVKAIELLDRELAEAKISEAKYKKRNKELTGLLAEVLREIDLEQNRRRSPG